MINKKLIFKTAAFSALLLTAVASQAQVKLLKGVRDNLMDEANKDISLAKYEIDRVMQHSETRNMCAAYAWNGGVYTEIAVSDQAEIQALDSSKKAALIAGESFLRFYACSEEEQEKFDASTGASVYLPNAIIACFNAGVFASMEKGSYPSVKQYMDIVEKLLAYDKEEQAKKYSVSKEKAIYNSWRSAYTDSLVSEEIIHLERLMAIPSYMNSDIFIRMAEIYSARKEYDKALGYLETGKNKIPQKAGDFLDMQINIEIERENMVALLSKFNEAIAGNPDNAMYYFSRGVAYHKLKEDEVKAQDLAVRNGGKAAASKYHYSQGLSDYRKALELDNGYYNAMKNEAILMFDSANFIYKMRVRVASSEYERYNSLSVNLYKQALDKFEQLRASGYLKGQELLDALKDMKTICIKVNDTEGKVKYEAMYKSEKKKIEAAENE